MSFGQPAHQGPPAPHCYRHPDRETWISCARCGRPICPDCMVSAAVGFQCVECVAGAPTPRADRTPVGGRFAREGAVTNALIGVCVVLFLLVSLGGAGGGIARWGMSPLAIVVNGEWARLLTAMFLHAGWLHLAFNMYVLYILGTPLERMLGHRRFLVLYLVAGLGGSVASFVFSPANTISVGASGAIFGVMAAMIVVGQRLGYDMGQVVTLFVINVVLGFLLGGIDWRAHLGGAALGAVMGVVLSRRSRSASGRARVLLGQTLATVGILVALLLVIVWRTAEVRSLVGA